MDSLKPTASVDWRDGWKPEPLEKLDYEHSSVESEEFLWPWSTDYYRTCWYRLPELPFARVHRNIGAFGWSEEPQYRSFVFIGRYKYL
jgi:hypothetical protein